MADLGPAFARGGVVGQINVREKRDIARQGLTIQQSAIEQKREATEAAAQTQQVKVLREDTKSLLEIGISSISQADTPEQLQAARQFAVQSFEGVLKRAETIGMSPSVILAAQNRLDTALSQKEAAIQKGAAVGAGEGAALEAELGRPPTPIEQQRGAGVAPPEGQGKLFTVFPGDGSPAFEVAGSAADAIATGGPGARIAVSSATTLTGEQAGLTRATQTKQQEKAIQSEDIISQVPVMIQLIRQAPGSFGAPGVFTDVVLNKIAAQAFPGLFDMGVATARGFAAAMREGAIRSVSGDTRFSNTDRVEIEKLFPERGIIESDAAAIAKMQTLGIFMLNRQSLARNRLGEVENEKELLSTAQIAQALRSKTAKEVALAARGDNPTLTEAQAVQIIQIRFPRDFANPEGG